LGYGARIGILDGGFPVPSVSVSVMRRSIPEVTYGDLLDPAQDYQYSVDLNATNLRAVASTRLAILTLGAGLGWDRYTGDATVAFRDASGEAQPPVTLELESTRVMAFLDAGLELSVLRIGGELGYQGGADQDFAATFEGVDEDAGRWFGSVGLGIGF
ncbi:MAG: hypothetical protein ACREL6_11725, partial [Gemmatimonadales bacterium]